MGLYHVRYLGVPLCTKKLTIANCEVLIQQVKSKFTSWTVKTLSFAGRLLLIKTIIAGSIWVGWFKAEVLKGSLSNFWTMRPSTSNSWLVNKLFKLRDEVYTWIRMQVGNGESCRFWSDNWSPFGKLSQFLLSDQTSGLTETEDRYEWIVSDKPSSRYSTSEIYRKLRDREETVPWASILGNLGGDFQKMSPATAEELDQTLLSMQTLQGNKMAKKLTLLCWQSTIYWVWQERNKGYTNNQYRSQDAVIKLITDRISGYRFDSPIISSRYMQLWLLTAS
ncbi:uncharacterized protein LOC125594686 [Brassica napus]|uniref:uncharacterized protein LOC125594686 n=1 Tax=Brassica napus TaxID=3708 RepID=UPI0020785AF2|nr:uncharacterized protein LOC125594686 [Brassica napus]